MNATRLQRTQEASNIYKAEQDIRRPLSEFGLIARALGKFMDVKGMHYLASRFGGPAIRAAAFDHKFRDGSWIFDADAEVGLLLSRYGSGKAILIMGCGAAAGLGEVDTKIFSKVLGIDISAEALQRASRYSAPNIKFQKCDMVSFKCDDSYDLVLFSESLYYIPALRRKRFLLNLSKSLKPGGCFIVTIAHPEKYVSMLHMIRQNFHSIEDRVFEGSSRHLMVFSPASGL